MGGILSVSRQTTAQKDKHNAEVYARYSFRVRKDDQLYFYLEDFMKPKETSLNYLVTKLLNEFFSNREFEVMNGIEQDGPKAPDSD